MDVVWTRNPKKMVLLGGSFTGKTLWIFLELEKCTCSQCPARALVARSDCFWALKWLFLHWPTTTIVWPQVLRVK
jgi:hypothetical protein